MGDATSAIPTSGPDQALNSRHVAFFRQYGYLRIPALFTSEEMAQFETGFEAAFNKHFDEQTENLMHIKNSPLHVANQPDTSKERFLLPQISEYSPLLAGLPRDARITSIVRSLLGDGYRCLGTDGSIFNCSTGWHYDFFNDPFKNPSLKLSLYLDPLRHDSGAIRFMPGTNHDNEYSRKIRQIFNFRGGQSPEEVFGVTQEEAPAVTVETDPGDLVLWDYLTLHATFNGRVRRRQIGLNFTRDTA